MSDAYIWEIKWSNYEGRQPWSGSRLVKSPTPDVAYRKFKSAEGNYRAKYIHSIVLMDTEAVIGERRPSKQRAKS